MRARSWASAFSIALGIIAVDIRAVELPSITIDLQPGPASPSPLYFVAVTHGGGGTELVYFVARIDGVSTVWASDGSALGTVRIGDGEAPVVATPWGTVLFRGPWPGEGQEIIEGAPGVPTRLRYALVPGPNDSLFVKIATTPFHGRIVIMSAEGEAIALGAGEEQQALGAIGPEFAADHGVLSSSGLSGPDAHSYLYRTSLNGGWTVLAPDPDVIQPGVFQMISAFGDRACGKTHSRSHPGGALYCADLVAGHMRRVTTPGGEAPSLRDGTPYLRVGDQVVFVGSEGRIWQSDGTAHGLAPLTHELQSDCITAGGGSRIVERTRVGTARWHDLANRTSGLLPIASVDCESAGGPSGMIGERHRSRWRNVTAITGGGKLVLFDGAEATEVTLSDVSFVYPMPSFVGSKLMIAGSAASTGTEFHIIDMQVFEDGME